MSYIRKLVVLILALSGALHPGSARADSPAWVAFQVVAGLASIAGLGYSLLSGGSKTTTTTTTTTNEDGTTTETKTTTQSQRTAGSPAGADGDGVRFADHEIVWDRGHLVMDRALRTRPDLARGETLIGGYQRIDESLDIMLAPTAVQSLKVSTERVIDFQVGRSADVASDAEVPFGIFLAIDSLTLRTLDIPETSGAAELELIIKERDAARPLFQASFAVQQGKPPTVTGRDVKAERVKVADDLLILRNVLGMAKASLAPRDRVKAMTIIIRTTGYGERTA